MNLDEAILHCNEVANKACEEHNGLCASQHLQLAKWLQELKAYRKLADDFKKFLNLNYIK